MWSRILWPKKTKLIEIHILGNVIITHLDELGVAPGWSVFVVNSFWSFVRIEQLSFAFLRKGVDARNRRLLSLRSHFLSLFFRARCRS